MVTLLGHEFDLYSHTTTITFTAASSRGSAPLGGLPRAAKPHLWLSEAMAVGFNKDLHNVLATTRSACDRERCEKTHVAHAARVCTREQRDS